jgi:hypothetical protein
LPPRSARERRLVEHYEPAAIGEAGDVARILEVEGHGGSAPRRGHLPGKGGLAHLACSEERNDRGLAQQGPDVAFGGRAEQGHGHIEISAMSAEFSG